MLFVTKVSQNVTMKRYLKECKCEGTRRIAEVESKKDRIESQFFKFETNNGSLYNDEDHPAGKPKYLSTRLKEARRDGVERESKSNRLLTWFVIHGTKQRVRGRP